MFPRALYQLGPWKNKEQLYFNETTILSVRWGENPGI